MAPLLRPSNIVICEGLIPHFMRRDVCRSSMVNLPKVSKFRLVLNFGEHSKMTCSRSFQSLSSSLEVV